MILESILPGLQLISSVTGALYLAHAVKNDAELTSTLNRVEYLLSSIQTQTRGLSSGMKVPLPVIRSYTQLLQTLRDSPSYREHLELVPTGKGTWLVRRRRRYRQRSTILRDPHGEFSDPAGEVVEIGDDGHVRQLQRPVMDSVDPLSSWIPELPSACRCKDLIGVREVVALTLMKGRILAGNATKQRRFRWLDIGCGRGGILCQMRPVLGDLSNRVHYTGVDIEPTYKMDCERMIRRFDLNHHLYRPRVIIHDVTRCPLEVSLGQFDYVTMLNVLHEIPPFSLFDVLRTAIDRCKPNGTLSIIDMARLPHLEWGAITWEKEDLLRLIKPLMMSGKQIPASVHQAYVTKYHRSVDVHEITIHRSCCNVNALRGKPEDLRKNFTLNLRRTLRRMLQATSARIVDNFDQAKAPSNHDSKESSSEKRARLLSRLLWRYYAIAEALGIAKSCVVRVGSVTSATINV